MSAYLHGPHVCLAPVEARGENWKLELQVIVICHVNVGIRTWFLWKSSQWVTLLPAPFSGHLFNTDVECICCHYTEDFAGFRSLLNLFISKFVDTISRNFLGERLGI